MPLPKLRQYYHRPYCLSLYLRNPLRYFPQTWLKYKALSGIVHRTSTITPPTFLWNYTPLYIFVCARSVTLKTFENFLENWYKYKASSDNVQRKFTHNYAPFVNFSMKIMSAQKLCNPLRCFFVNFGTTIKDDMQILRTLQL